ncbi:MAG: RNA-binding protein [Saprospiraceae bacterium]
MNIFVAKLNYRTSVESLEDLFANYGAVSSCKIIMDRETGRSKGYGFVEMENDDEGAAAIEALNEFDFEEQTIIVKESQPRDNNRGGGRSFRPRNNDGYNSGRY